MLLEEFFKDGLAADVVVTLLGAEDVGDEDDERVCHGGAYRAVSRTLRKTKQQM